MPADLAILIVTLVRRRQFLQRLMRRLQPQVEASDGRVVIYTLEDSGAEKIGEKRQRMLDSVERTGEKWLCFIDDDDLVSTDYVSSILTALDQDPDVVGFHHRYYEDGKLRGRATTSVTCRKWSTEILPDGTQKHYRTPNHLNPVRREMALTAGFPPEMAGEDAEYSFRLFRLFPNMREVFIDRVLYDYFYRTPMLRAESESLAVPDVQL